MIWKMKELEKFLNSIDYNQLWDKFTKTKYAIYNDKNFYISDDVGIDLNLIKKDSCFVGNVDARFIGNTAISINNNYVAIWNEDTITKDTDNAKLASLIIHEMFHCFQLASGEKRFPNELLGIDYPITIENVNLRMLERRYLLGASIENDKEKRMKLLTLYFNIRNKREKLLGSIIEYEKAIESIEGTAVYVEYKARTQLIPNNRKSILEEYIKGFTEINEKNLKIRQSTYNQGLLLGLIADEYIPNWKDKFANSELFLSDFIKSELEIKEVNIDYKHEDLAAIEQCVINWTEQIDTVFDEFERRSKLNSLEEGFQVTGFDPMNIVKRNQEIIHKNFLRVKIGECEQIIKGPVKALVGDHFFDVKRIEW
ncbi:MAG: hypothetical protein EWM50_02320 [Gottschalkiaceae bacterium]|nr:MAG: hypothetical protein EWM50_02320 [Gottschalkiaceae bacterium]